MLIKVSHPPCLFKTQLFNIAVPPVLLPSAGRLELTNAIDDIDSARLFGRLRDTPQNFGNGIFASFRCIVTIAKIGNSDFLDSYFRFWRYFRVTEIGSERFPVLAIPEIAKIGIPGFGDTSDFLVCGIATNSQFWRYFRVAEIGIPDFSDTSELQKSESPILAIPEIAEIGILILAILPILRCSTSDLSDPVG